MRTLKNALRALRSTVARVRSLVKDEDHDDWYAQHDTGHEKPPNLAGPWAQGGG